jgi:hypothetical protein
MTLRQIGSAHDLSVQGDWTDKEVQFSIKVRVFECLIDMCCDTVKHYRSDFYLDAMWINDHLVPDRKFYFSYNDYGTFLDFTKEMGACRDNAFECELINVHYNPDRSWTKWMFSIVQIKKEGK